MLCLRNTTSCKSSSAHSSPIPRTLSLHFNERLSSRKKTVVVTCFYLLGAYKCGTCERGVFFFFQNTKKNTKLVSGLSHLASVSDAASARKRTCNHTILSLNFTERLSSGTTAATCYICWGCTGAVHVKGSICIYLFFQKKQNKKNKT